MSVVKLRIGPADHGRPMTLEEFREAEEQPGYLYELSRGVLEVSDIYRMRHPGRIRRIAHGSDVRLLIPELKSDRHPDLAIVFHGAPLNARGRQIPQWISEVVSPGAKARRRDYEVKSEEYLALNIGEYWIIDPFEKKVTVRVRQETPEGPVWSERVFTGDEIIVSDLLPGLQLTVAELWANTEPGPENGDGE
jgi:Uma2 family endonuclease